LHRNLISGIVLEIDMRLLASQLVFASVAALGVGHAAAQSSSAVAMQAGNETVSAQQSPGQPANAPVAGTDQANLPPAAASVLAPTAASPAVQILESFKDSDIKFDLRDLMDTLRDKRHEGWVLAAYPDPKTGHPLIGAGFTLDLPERQHAQPDPLNPHAFLEPSSADLWEAAGLAPDRLDAILDQYSIQFAKWKKKGFRRRIPTLEPQITEDDAEQLLRISAVQAIYNAKAYCRNFDRMTGPQQMAVSQLVYQIGVNLVHFDEFLSQINDGAPPAAIAVDAPLDALSGDRDYWSSVQHTLIQTQWARLYRTRAIAVIAMLDPSYGESPGAAEHLVGASLRPAVAHRRHRSSASVDKVSAKSRSGHSGRHANRQKRAHAKAKREA
jgi:GH24 family phage-related lysozyme (muramidase)